jgi:hypothetical protein
MGYDKAPGKAKEAPMHANLPAPQGTESDLEQAVRLAESETVGHLETWELVTP